MEETLPRKGQRLSSGNNKRRKEYITKILPHIDAYKVIKRVERLYSHLNNGKLNHDNVAEYNKLDDCITEGMLSVERKLPKKKHMIWTPCPAMGFHKIHYAWLLL